MTAAPLSGVMVLDFTNVLAGPFCTQQLAFLGADVVKVEAPGRGDLARNLGADAKLAAAGMGVSFLAQNAGKRSVGLDLKSTAGRKACLALARQADVVVENFRPGVMERLSLGAGVLHQENPSLIIASISGFGQTGPLSSLPAYDQIVQGMSGVMSVTGTPEGLPTRAGFPICDTVGGLTAAMAICAALAARDGEGGRPGAVIDVSMLEATLATMGWAVSNWLMAGVAPARRGNDNATAAPSGAFQASDGLVNIAANEQHQWEALCQAIGRGDLTTDPRFRARSDRVAHRGALTNEIEQALGEASVAHWIEVLGASGVPSGPVLAVPEVLALPQVEERGVIMEVGETEGRRVRIVRPGFRWDGANLPAPSAPPSLGENGEQVLREAGLSDDEIAAATGAAA